MDIYLADAGSRFKTVFKVGESEVVFNGVNILQSYYYVDKFTEKYIIPHCKNFMLDSGAFSFLNSAKNVNWDEYVNLYSQFIINNDIKQFFELDIDSLIGYNNVLKLRYKLENMTSKPCIPVWHKSRGINEFIKMCDEYQYVAIGGIVTKEISPQEYKYFPKLIKIAHEHGAKIHGLGFTVLSELPKYHFDSVDSTSWTGGNRFGHIYEFNGYTLIKHKRPDGKRLASSDKTAYHNYMEWVKFMNYAKSNL